MNLHIEKMSLEDLEIIKDILSSDFDNFWTFNTLKEELLCSNSHIIIAKNEKNEIIGFAGIKIILDEADIMNIVVRKNLRRQWYWICSFGKFNKYIKIFKY